jgi:hypothetical protein
MMLKYWEGNTSILIFRAYDSVEKDLYLKASVRSFLNF